MANLPGALFYSFAPSLWGMGLSLVGVYFLVAPGRLLSTWRPRAVGMVLLSCICIPADDLIVPGEFRMIVFDIGQGTAVLIETAKHRLLYDTGPKTSPSNNAGERHILPYLRARGIKEIDRLAISHKDTDHVGGALSLMDSIRFADLHGTLPAHHYVLQRAQGLSIPALTCQAGQEWFWDGIRFKVWHPYADMTFNSMHHFGKPNALSCVIEVSNQSFSVWLTGDVERGGEAIISNEYKDSKQLASILLVPHHGSATSSTSHFLDALSPSWAIVQAGYRNRYRHPNTQVMGRYIERDIPVLQTIHTGAQIWHLGKEKGYRTDWREEVRRIWHR
ncbi:MAG: MBL fold metallo-hydrolase [Burkholderiaceae bacterium]|nr:MBL fold metallo-hydrolase [Burkholderiaceae bacterium]